MLQSSDTIDIDRVLALAALLDCPAPSLGDRLPLHWQLGFFLPRPRTRELGGDGHPVSGYPAPPAPGLRRMFAGGRTSMSPGITVGATLTARTEVVSSREKQGRSGPMTFLTTRTTLVPHDASPERLAGEDALLTEERDIVYLPPAPPRPAVREPDAPLPVVGPTSTPVIHEVVRTVDVDPVLLFRFSALTYNAHRIHYDRAYATETEGHPDLVVHGPLQALLMAEAGTSILGTQPTDFDYRLVSPLLLGQGLDVRAGVSPDGVDVSITDRTGRVTARGSITAHAPDRQPVPDHATSSSRAT